MIARRRKGQHYLAPAIGQFREAMQQQDTRPPRFLETRLQYVHIKAVHALDKAAADTLAKGSGAIGCCIVHKLIHIKRLYQGQIIAIFRAIAGNSCALLELSAQAP